MFRTHIITKAFVATIALCSVAAGQTTRAADPNGVLLRPIPDRLVVLTFDDGCASHATVVAPMLKKYGFGGSFYVCDFDSFWTRKDWYLTWRQMRTMDKDGLEIGNHTRGHAGGCDIGSYQQMEDELLAHGVPKPTTVAWPVHHVNSRTFPDLAANGYTFGRSGHNRVFRPTIDNCYDIPSMSVSNLESFVKAVQQAVNGKIVTICFHGVPDGEHPQVGLDPATFEEMMQYLKENNYKAIALRDLAQYIDSSKAGKLPPTADNVKFPDDGETVKGDTPFACKDIKSLKFPGMPEAGIFQTRVTANVPYGTDITALAPQIVVSPGATITPASGVARNFTRPRTYTVTGRNGATKVFTVTVNTLPVSDRKSILTIGFRGDLPTVVSGTNITVCVPNGTGVESLAPKFTLSPCATAAPPSGTPLNLSKPQKITVTAQDGSTQVYTVTAAKARDGSILTWHDDASGKWSDASKWHSSAGVNGTPSAAGREDYILNFNAAGSYEFANDLKQGFQLNQLSLGTGQGQNLKLTGNRLAFTPNRAAGIAPAIHVTCIGQRGVVAAPLELSGDVAVNMSLLSELTLEGLISGDGRLVLNSTDPNPSSDNYHYMACRLRLDYKRNTYRGGTVINSGRFMLFSNDRGMGSGPVTLHENGRIWLVMRHEVTNPLISYGGIIEGDSSWNAPVTLNGNLRVTGNMTFHETGGGMSGPGGLMMIGAGGPWGWVNGGTTQLCGANTYRGPTTVVRGTLSLKKAASLYNADASKWTPAKISVHAPATLRISVGGKDEFTGQQAGTLLTSLTTGIDNNGLMGGSFFCIDTSNATDTITIPATITDSSGVGGGWFFFKKAGTGVLELGGMNNYTGQTFLEAGTLIVSSLNRVSGGGPSSSLGAPTTPEAGTIEIAGDCGLIYTGKGEVTDRAIDLTGNNPQTVTLEQSGSGLLKYTGNFVFTGFGHNKTIVLKGSTVGTGEIAGDIMNPYDRKRAATTALTKTGTGVWTLSGINTYTGPTTVNQGTLSLADARSLSDKAEVHVAEGATLGLSFKGEMRIRKLYLDGKLQLGGAYSAANAGNWIKGAGVLRVQPENHGERQ